MGSRALLITLSIGLGTLLSASKAWPQQRSLTFKEAMQTALEKNMAIKIAKLDEALGQTFIDASKADFDVIFTSLFDYTDDRDKPASTVLGTRIETINANAGLRKKMATGTLFDVQFINKQQKTNSIFTTLPTYWDPRLSLTVTQPLLNNFFGYADRRHLKQGLLKDTILAHQSKDKIEAALAAIAVRYWERSAAQENISIKK